MTPSKGLYWLISASVRKTGLLIAAYVPILLTSRTLPLLTLQPHLRAVTSETLPSENELAVNLSNEPGIHLMSLGVYSEAEFYLQHALAIRQKVLGPERPDMASSLNNLAFLYNSQGKYE